MPDEIPAPPPSMPTRPALTQQMLSDDRVLGAAPPGAGGWTPKKIQVVLLSAGVAGALAVLELVGAADVTPKVLAVAFGKAAVGYIATYLATLSAGHRQAQ